MTDSPESIIGDYHAQIDRSISAADWQHLEQLLNSRRDYIEAIFCDPQTLTAKQIADLQTLALTIQQQDHQFIARINQLKEQTVLQQQQINQGKKAVAAYQT